MWNDIFTIIQLAAVSVLWVGSEPTIIFRHWLYVKKYGHIEFENKWHWRLLNCAMCTGFQLSFWFYLIWDHQINIGSAAIASILAEIIYRKLNSGNIN